MVEKVLEVIGTGIVVGREVESARKVTKRKMDIALGHILQMDNSYEKEEVVVNIRVRGREKKENGTGIFSAVNHLKTRNPIESIEQGLENALQIGETEIDLENGEFLLSIILNKFLFLFIMEISHQGQLWSGR